jgi:hypothetical protein
MKEAPDGEVLALRHDDRPGRGHVSPRLQPARQRRRQLRVDEGTHLGGPENRMVVLSGGELQDSRDVLVLEVGVIGEDLVARRPGG